MRVKAIIMGPDRQNQAVRLSQRKVAFKTFRFGGYQYFLHPDRFQVTWERSFRRFWWKEYFTTFYYTKGCANPLPVPSFDKITPNPYEKKIGKKTGKKDWLPIFDNGVTAEDLAVIFTPWFYRIIAQSGMQTWDYIKLMISISTLGGVLYLIYLMDQLMQIVG